MAEPILEYKGESSDSELEDIISGLTNKSNEPPSNSSNSSNKNWDTASVASSGISFATHKSIKRVGASSVNSKLTRSDSYQSSDGRFVESSTAVRRVEETDLFSAPGINNNNIGITSRSNTIKSLKKWSNVCKWMGLLFLLIFGFAIFFIVVSDTAVAVENTGTSDDLDKPIHLLKNSSLIITTPDTKCNLNYTCTKGCTPEINRIEPCCSGCYMSDKGECGLNVNIEYKNVPSSEDVTKVYLIVTNDGTHFWQTGRPLPIYVCIIIIIKGLFIFKN